MKVKIKVQWRKIIKFIIQKFRYFFTPINVKPWMNMIGTKTWTRFEPRRTPLRRPELARELLEFRSGSQETRTAFGRWLSSMTATSMLEMFHVGDRLFSLKKSPIWWSCSQHLETVTNINVSSPTGPHPKKRWAPVFAMSKLSTVKSMQSQIYFKYKLYFRTSWM